MYILNAKNKKIVDTMIQIAKQVSKKLSDNSDFIEVSDKILSDNLGYSILNTIYKDKQLDMSKDKDLKVTPTIIVPINNSILTLINYNALTENMVKHNINISSSDTINAIYNKFNSTISTFKYNTLKRVKRYAYKVDSYIKASNKEINNTDLFKLEVISVTALYELMRDKGYLDTPIVTHNLFKFNISDIEFIGELKDMELAMFRDEELKHLDSASIQMFFNNFTNITNTDHLYNFLSSLKVKDINNLIFTLLPLIDRYNKTKDLDLAKIIEKVNQRLTQLYKEYETLLYTKNVIIGFIKEDKHITLTVIDDLFKEYSENNGTIKALYGYIISKINDDTPNNEFLRVFSKIEDLLINKDKYERLNKAHVNSIIIANRNNNLSNLINYYLFALDVILTSDEQKEFRDDINTYIKSQDIGSLLDTKEMSLNIFRYIIMRNTVFNEYIKGFKEAETFMKDEEPEVLAAYATFRLLLIYLSVQTTLINEY